ncbi:MAG: T9SS type A sorting domain-containing protein [Bacteroidota bacterium]
MKRFYPLFFLCILTYSLSAQTTWDNFNDSRKADYGFISGTFIPYNENPDKDGNTSLTAASYTRNPAETFDVLIMDVPMADLSDYVSGTKQMSIDVWSPSAGTTIQITLENSTLALPANFPVGRHSIYLATTTVAMGWETLTFSFNTQPDASVANDNVDRLVLLFAPDSNTGGTYFWDNFNGPEFANDPCEGVTSNANIFNDFECSQNVSYTFSHSGVNFRRVVNPDQSGVNTSSHAGRYVRNGGEMVDVQIGKFDGNIDILGNSVISLDVWDPNAPTTIRLSLQNENGDVILAMDATTSTSSAWEKLTFDPTSVAGATDITQFVLLFDPESNTDDEYFFDNFEISGSVSVDDLEDVTSFMVAPNPSPGLTNFQYELREAAAVDLAIFDVTGKQVAQVIRENQLAGPQTVSWQGDDLSNGIYFYTLTVNGKAATGKIVLNK